jgi:hypothetical protein
MSSTHRAHVWGALSGAAACLLASGQSNMAFPLQAMGDWRTGVKNADLEIARAGRSRTSMTPGGP